MDTDLGCTELASPMVTQTPSLPEFQKLSSAPSLRSPPPLSMFASLSAKDGMLVKQNDSANINAAAFFSKFFIFVTSKGLSAGGFSARCYGYPK